MTAFFSSNFLVIAHRGASAEAPENTLPAFARALAVGAPAVELDVYAAHGELWVIHDDALDRTTNGTGRLEDHNPAALRAFDAGNGAAAGVEAAEGRWIVILQAPGPVGGAIERIVMDDPKLPMGRINVKLHRRGPHGEGPGEGRERVLRRFCAGAPVGNHQKIR